MPRKPEYEKELLALIKQPQGTANADENGQDTLSLVKEIITEYTDPETNQTSTETLYVYHNRKNGGIYIPVQNMLKNYLHASMENKKLFSLAYPRIMYVRLEHDYRKDMQSKTLQLMISIDGIQEFVNSKLLRSRQAKKEELHALLTETMKSIHIVPALTNPGLMTESNVQDILTVKTSETVTSVLPTDFAAPQEETSAIQQPEETSEEPATEEVATEQTSEDDLHVDTMLLGIPSKYIESHVKPMVEMIQACCNAESTVQNQANEVEYLRSENQRLQKELDEVLKTRTSSKHITHADTAGVFDDIAKLSHHCQHIQTIVGDTIRIWINIEKGVVNQHDTDAQQQTNLIYDELAVIIGQRVYKTQGYVGSTLNYIVTQTNYAVELLQACYQVFERQGCLKYLLIAIKDCFKLKYLNTSIYYLNRMLKKLDTPIPLLKDEE